MDSRFFRAFLLLSGIGLAFFLRLIVSRHFLISGDEWYTIQCSQDLGACYMAFPYFLGMRLILDHYGISEFLMRLMAVLISCGGVALIYLYVKKISKSNFAALVSLFLAATSPCLLFDGVEIRYYGLFLVCSAAILIFAEDFYRKQNVRTGLLVCLAAIFCVLCHWNIIFLLAGAAYYVTSERIKCSRQSIRNACAFIFFVLLVFCAIIFFRQEIYSVSGSLAFRDAESLGGMIGWHWSGMIRPGLAFFCFLLGYNTSPFEVWIVLPIVSIYLFLMVRGILYYKKVRNLSLNYWLGLAVLPVVLLFWLAEPLATTRFSGSLGAKQTLFAYPLIILAVAGGVASLEKRWVKIVLCLILAGYNLFAFHRITNPGFSFYQTRYENFKKAAPYLEKIKNEDVLFVIDRRAHKSFFFYNPTAVSGKKTITPWEFNDAGEAEASKHDILVFVSNNWREFHGETYKKMFEIINKKYTLTDGFSESSLIFYIFRKKESANVMSVPAEGYDLRYTDLKLPVQPDADNPDSRLLGSFALNNERREFDFDWNKTGAGNLSLILNLEDSQGIASNEVIGRIELKSSGEKNEIQLIKNKNVFDVFHEFQQDSRGLSSDQIGWSWNKQPLISTQFKYPGSFFPIKAHLYRLVINKEQLIHASGIKIHYTNPSGSLRIWKIYFNGERAELLTGLNTEK